MFHPTSSRPGSGRWPRRWRSGAVTVLAALAAVLSLVALQTPAASASAAAPGHAAVAGHTASGARALAARVAAQLSHSHAGQGAQRAAPKLKPVIRTAVRHDTSPLLRKMKPSRKVTGKSKVRALPLRSPPHMIGGSKAAHTADIQGPKLVTTNDMPSFGQNFEGVGSLDGVLPPDTNMAVGPNDVVQTTNFHFAVYNKTGGTLLGPETLGTLWQGFGGECDPSVDPAANGGDPVVMYDEAANRFIITQLAYPQLELGTGGYHECIAVSQTGDPTGAWYRYDFLFSNNTLNDYPKFGVWPDAYYESNNDFLNGASFTGVTVTAYDRAQMIAGQQASMVQFTIGSQYASLLPSNTQGAALGFNPPSGAPNPYFMSCDAANGGPCTSDQMDEWDFHVDWSTPANSTFGNNGDPTTTLPVAAFNSNLCNFSRDCIPQPGTSQGLDALSDRLMYQSAYRNLGNGTQAVVLNQTVNVSNSGGNQAGVRWYELTNTGSGWSVAQQGTYAPDTDNRWMGSANIDASGDIAVGYSVSSASTDPSIRVAGRLAGDPSGQLSQGETSMIAGGGVQTDGAARWGDYSAMQVDPTDGCTFWYTTEYYGTTSDANWQTRIGSFKFPSCTAGPHGTLTGTVTDSSNGHPIAGATVATSTASTTTDSSGHYSMTLPAASYNVTYSAFGYATQTQSVQVTDGGTTTENVALSPSPSVHVTGTVTDGSGHGWPLHASITIQGDPNGPVWTNPATGAYSVDLPENATYAATVTADLPGYKVVNDTITVGSSDLTHNISVPVDASTCTAPGYQFNYGTPALNENFDDYTGDGGTTPPPGWTVQDNLGTGKVWTFNDPGHRGNLTGGSGNFATVDSDYYYPSFQDTSLVTPVLNLSGDATPVIRFHNDYFGYPGVTANVDMSTDGGATWTTVWHHTSDSVRGPDLETVPITQAAGQSNVELRFHYTQNLYQFGFWWQIDDVVVQNRTCDPTPGGLVVGQTTDANTKNGLDGVTVTSTDNPSDKATSSVTGDPGIGHGYYWLFSSLTGSHQFTAAKAPYQTASQTVNVAADSATLANFALNAGQLSVSPSSISTTQVLGNTTNTTMTITNTGTAPANVKLDQRGGAFQILNAKGSKLKLVPLGDDPQSEATPHFLGGHSNDASPIANAGPPANPTWSTITSYPTGVMDNSADFINGKEYSVGGLNSSFAVLNNGYVYDPGLNNWSAIANMPVGREKPGVAADNGKLYVTGGWGSAGNPIAETDVYDPSSNSWSTVSNNPHPTAAPGVAVANGNVYLVGGCQDSNCTASSTVEVYNPSTDSWSTAAAYPHADSWMSCGGINGKVYCSGGVNGSTTYSDAYVYDPGSNSWSPIASMPIDLWGSASGAPNGLFIVSTGVTNGFSTITNQGYAYDPTTNTWTSIPNAQFPVYRSGGSCGFYKIGGSSGGFNPSANAELLSGLTQCGTVVIPWMSESPTTATLQPGQSVNVTVTLTATQADQVTQPGTYTAQIGFEQDTPYDVPAENVTMNVTPPSGWGKIQGTLNGENCSQVTAPIRGVVYANSQGKKAYQFTVRSDTSGNYAFWGPASASPWSLQATAAGWIPVTQTESIRGGKTTTVNFTLRPQSC